MNCFTRTSESLCGFRFCSVAALIGSLFVFPPLLLLRALNQRILLSVKWVSELYSLTCLVFLSPKNSLRSLFEIMQCIKFTLQTSESSLFVKTFYYIFYWFISDVFGDFLVNHIDIWEISFHWNWTSKQY